MIDESSLLREILKYVIGFGGGGGAVVLLFFLFPNQAEKWAALFWKLLVLVVRRGEKKYIAYDIQSKVNRFVAHLSGEIHNYDPIGIHIRWISEEETPSQFFRENRLIIRMRRHEDQNMNFVNASMVFVSKAMLSRTKKYLSGTQRDSIDLFVGKKLFERYSSHIVDRFFEDYFSLKAISNKKIMDLIEKYHIIDKVGMFFPVLVQELTFLGEKVFYKPRKDSIIAEVNCFIEFLVKYAHREVGDEKTEQNFEGIYCRCGIIIIAKKLKRDIGVIQPYLRYINILIEKGLENYYLIGSASRSNRQFIEEISKDCQRKFGFEKYLTKKFKGSIKISGERIESNNYMILLRKPGSQRYYDEEYQRKYFDQMALPASSIDDIDKADKES